MSGLSPSLPGTALVLRPGPDLPPEPADLAIAARIRRGEGDWMTCLNRERALPYFQRDIRPLVGVPGSIPTDPKVVFKPFLATPLQETRVVILGQDPYPREADAMGLAFSVPAGRPLAGSLKNILDEYCADTRFPRPKSGDLTPWTKQGVLLLNAALTTEVGKPGAHTAAWMTFTQRMLTYLQMSPHGVVYLAWGKKAQAMVDSLPKSEFPRKVVESVHPSPRNNWMKRGFRGSWPFSKANWCFDGLGEERVDWRLP